MKQRSEQERVAELQAKIEAIRTREERKRAKANPAVRNALVALKAIDKVLAEVVEPEARRPVEESRAGLAAFVATHGLATPVSSTTVATTPKAGGKRGRLRRADAEESAA